MNLNKIFLNILSIFAFIYLVICPSIHELGNNIRHDVALKVEAKILQKNFEKGFSFTPLKLFNNTQAGVFVQSKTVQELPIFSSSNSTLNLSILSTIRLVL